MPGITIMLIVNHEGAGFDLGSVETIDQSTFDGLTTVQDWLQLLHTGDFGPRWSALRSSPMDQQNKLPMGGKPEDIPVDVLLRIGTGTMIGFTRDKPLLINKAVYNTLTTVGDWLRYLFTDAAGQGRVADWHGRAVTYSDDPDAELVVVNID